MKNPLFDQCAVLAAAEGHISIAAVMRAFNAPSHEAAAVCDELHAAGIVGTYDATDCRPYLGGEMPQQKTHERRAAWLKAREKCMNILGMEKDEARAWWMALDDDRRAEVMRAAVVPFRHRSMAWDELPVNARAALRAQHDKRRRTWSLLNAEFSGRVAA